jgi:hypothetical protein
MSTPLEIPLVHRPTAFPGQRLVASDLAAMQRYHRVLRWLHNRALHDWGVALGLTVTGNRGDKTIRIAAGAALDRDGREILLAEPVELQVPAVAGTAAGQPMPFYVTASYLEDDALTPETRGGDCDTEGAVRLAERCQLRFQHPPPFAGTDWVSGTDLVLASITVKDCKLAAPVTADDRREVQGAGPHVASGSTVPQATPWDLWRDPTNDPIGVRTTVSTVDAGFATTPHYMARVGGNVTTSQGGAGIVIVLGYVQILDASPTSFTCGVLLPPGTATLFALNTKARVLTPAFMPVLQSVLQWHVVWLGVEG